MTDVPRALPFLDAIVGAVESRRTSSADRPIRLATIDPAYDPFAGYPGATPPARVTFEGETVLSSKAYAVAHGFIPRPGQRVYLLPVGNAFLIAGAINTQSPQGFWQDPDGVDAGTELGGGSYFDTTDGLVLETDATVAGVTQSGTFRHAARNLRIPEIQFGTASLTKGTAANAHTENVTFPTAWPAGTTVVMPEPGIATSAGGTGFLMARATAVTNTGFQLAILKTDAALANFTLSSLPVHWVAYALPA